METIRRSLTTRRGFLQSAGGAAALAATGGYPEWVFAQTRSGVLNAMLNVEPATLNYALLNTSVIQSVCGSINESLLLFDWQLKPQPNLARSFDVSPDGLVYTFELEPDVKWHDGKPFTSKDVVFTCAKMLRELNPRSRAAMDRCESITAEGDHKVVFKLKEPFNAFILAFMASTGPMMPAHIYEGTDFRNNPANTAPIGTGPFKFAQWSKGNFIKLVRNDNYWRKGQPGLDEVNFRIIASAEQRAVALETGAVDMAFGDDLDPIDVPRFRDNPGLVMVQNAYDAVGEITLMEINQRTAPFNDRRFRAAIMHAMDRNFLVDQLNFGLGRVADSPIFSTVPYYDPKALTQYEFSPAKAKALLDDMGLKPGAGGVRHKFSVLMLPNQDGPWRRAGEYSKQALADVGLDVELQSTDVATFYKRNGDWDYDVMWNSYGQFGDPAIGMSRFFLSNNIRKGVPQTNTQGYSNPKVDDLLQKGATAVKREDAQAAYSELQKILTEDVAMLWMYERRKPLFHTKKFKDVVLGPNGPCDGFGAAKPA
ncbi:MULTISPECIES: ABC transporter substrate-binding protein [unclassified Chelatococcus]|uniref:ABC transporter substrate-binding protein n=1 Tax=unclassified Chelatococcus TaxID=2638111 RepID=UPI001BCFBA13|nr:MULTISPECIES: ABC transporter substrate-binding protein [unclassified Chelatococcus]CAH1656406.1 Peptide/nickel transport system substrate-binding protein [Hyphomicrobiales bacterium]MBS7740529.1 ABC transporter substrate-binding protein [Chelatococcus sp. HY11]MBX3544687.1 ABC transporter substrate-binding protein [Chelatococcus sp.]MCO5078228.1 ABC transporter substrate-binding protein [Chelatococcus sp.]CAH1684754.1 Peptide/nickel transport system substrate-binding protein [Hyphomicrobia